MLIKKLDGFHIGLNHEANSEIWFKHINAKIAFNNLSTYDYPTITYNILNKKYNDVFSEHTLWLHFKLFQIFNQSKYIYLNIDNLDFDMYISTYTNYVTHHEIVLTMHFFRDKLRFVNNGMLLFHYSEIMLLCESVYENFIEDPKKLQYFNDFSELIVKDDNYITKMMILN